ncbi:loricrin-like [Thrips palmi]|uniref:lysozyme n=1 Tax=Thrips palmi TaxID=161013 RepID=A0A6P8Y8G0_THRPL|nr:loricrin-like [Thrips palmi]
MLHPVPMHAVLAALLATAVLEAAAGVDDACLSCLCQAATGCDANRDCDGDTCGMFAISRQYWKDAGEPGGDFETCALDPACATQCVQGYLQRFARDCDGGVGCADYSRIHHLGREGCSDALDGDFARRLDTCNASIPLGDFYARAVARPSRQDRQGNSWSGGGGNTAPRQPSGGSQGSPSFNFSPSLSLSRTVTVNPTYQSGSTPGNQYQGGTSGYQSGYERNGGYQSGATGYNSVSGYQSGGYQSGAYEEGGGSSLWSGRRRVGGYRGGSGYGQSESGWTGAYGQQGSVLWGAGEGYRPYSGGAYSRNGAVSASRGVSANCLNCICNALTGCDPYADCSNGGCGAFKLSLAYWQDCGSPGQSYEYCTRDYSCSSSCVQTYVYKYAQDCNGDGVVDCRDYARIHRLGGFGCRGSLDWSYRTRVDACSAY